MTRAKIFLATSLTAGAVLLTHCTPKAEPVKGPIAEQVAAALSSGTASFDHSSWDEMLANGTRDGLADYSYFETNRAKLDAYLASIANAELSILTRQHLLAFLINAYNAYTVQSILDHPGVESIRDIDGVWDKRTHRVAGFDLTLDNIEHNVIRPFLKDPRIHFAVNCASQSCAPLPPWAFDGNTLEDQLQSWTQAFLTNSKFTRIEGDTLYLSKLLDWYGDDFLLEDASPRADSLVEFAGRYNPAIAARQDQLKVAFSEYDWALNNAASP